MSLSVRKWKWYHWVIMFIVFGALFSGIRGCFSDGGEYHDPEISKNKVDFLENIILDIRKENDSLSEISNIRLFSIDSLLDKNDSLLGIKPIYRYLKRRDEINEKPPIGDPGVTIMRNKYYEYDSTERTIRRSKDYKY